MDDNVEDKVKLVAKGYRQRQYIDYDETFPLMVMIKFIYIHLIIVVFDDYEK